MHYVSQLEVFNQILGAASDPLENSIFSPTCNVEFFKLLSELVDESTKTDFVGLFNYEFQQLNRLLKSKNKDNEKRANKVFQIKDFPLEKNTEIILKETYESEIESVDDQKPKEIEESIEAWLKTYTNGRVTQCMNGPSINRANYYALNWAKIFDKSETTMDKFHQNEFVSIDVEMMNISGKFKYLEDEILDVTVVELPCVNKAGIRQKDLSVMIYLPNSRDSDAVDRLCRDGSFLKLMSDMENKDVQVSIPKFRSKSEVDMKHINGKKFFATECTYNLTKFTNSNAYINKVPTQGFLEVNEDSIVAVATTGCDICFKPILKEMILKCEVINRFAKTLITHKFFNVASQAQETTFSIILPENAFITEFVMVIEGKSYKSYIKEKEEAKKTYDEAVASGRSAAHVAASARDSNKFTVSVNVAPKSDAQFQLIYEELLERKLDQYELVLNIHPGQVLQKLNVEVRIEESNKIKFVKIPAIRSGNDISENNEEQPPQTTLEIDDKKAVINFNPDGDDQKKIANSLKKPDHSGISGQFVVQYDVEVNKNGEVLLRDGYFVHFYVPDDLPALPKHVVFALDTSGSMSGRKIQQLRTAMTYILDQINSDDLISLLDFKHKINVYNIQEERSISVQFEYEENYLEVMHKFEKLELPKPRKASPAIINSAKVLAQNLRADGSTHIIGALEVALFLIRNSQDDWKSHQPIVVFLTDGEPSDGVTDTEKITDIVTRLNTDMRVPIFTLSFGEDADKNFLRKLSLKNFGFSRHIYEAADASLQLQQFYRQISSPLMSNITFKYEDAINDVTRIRFPIYFRGCDLVICGRYTIPDYLGTVRCYRNELEVALNPELKDSPSSIERFWAFLTIKQLLEQSKVAEDGTTLRKQALELALKYSFVTEVTSLVVVKPEEQAAVDTENAAIQRNQPGFMAHGGGFGFRKMRMLHSIKPASIEGMSFGGPSRVPALNRSPGPALFGSASVASSGISFGGPPIVPALNTAPGPMPFGGAFGSSSLMSFGGPQNLCSTESLTFNSFMAGSNSEGAFATHSVTAPYIAPLSGNFNTRNVTKRPKKRSGDDDGSPIIFKADRPFLIVLQSIIQDEVVVLFIGKIIKPVF